MSLQTWYELKLQVATLTAQLKGCEESAIEEALERVAGEQKKTFPYGAGNHKVQVQFRTKKPKHTEDNDLDNLHAEIELEKASAASSNADVIAQIEADLDSLTKRLEELQNTDQGRVLQKQYDARAKQLEEKVPVLALKGV